MTEDRRYGILHRIWPGTQRLLLWGDPEMAAAYGRVSSFCGSNGVEIFEPLFFKGRKGSGLPGGRDAYADFAAPAAILRNTITPTASGAAIFTTRTATRMAGKRALAPTIRRGAEKAEPRSPRPAGFCRS
jgi:hypothetical protein